MKDAWADNNFLLIQLMSLIVDLIVLILLKALIAKTPDPDSLHFLREPTDGDVTPGGLIVFHCRASGGSPNQSPVIRWRKNGEFVELQQQPRYRQLRLEQWLCF